MLTMKKRRRAAGIWGDAQLRNLPRFLSLSSICHLDQLGLGMIPSGGWFLLVGLVMKRRLFEPRLSDDWKEVPWFLLDSTVQGALGWLIAWHLFRRHIGRSHDYEHLVECLSLLSFHQNLWIPICLLSAKWCLIILCFLKEAPTFVCWNHFGFGNW